MKRMCLVAVLMLIVAGCSGGEPDAPPDGAPEGNEISAVDEARPSYDPDEPPPEPEPPSYGRATPEPSVDGSILPQLDPDNPPEVYPEDTAEFTPTIIEPEGPPPAGDYVKVTHITDYGQTFITKYVEDEATRDYIAGVFLDATETDQLIIPATGGSVYELAIVSGGESTTFVFGNLWDAQDNIYCKRKGDFTCWRLPDPAVDGVIRGLFEA